MTAGKRPAAIASAVMACGLLAAAALPVGVAAQTPPAPDVAAVCAQSKAAGAMQMWERTGGNKGHAAKLLNLKRTTLVEKIKRLERA